MSSIVSVHPLNIKQGVVIIQIPLAAKPSWDIVHLLKKQCGPKTEDKPAGTELAVLAYALANAIELKVNGNPQDALKTKMASVGCDVQGRDFIITAMCVPTFSVVRKIIAVAVKTITTYVLKLKPLYKKRMDYLGYKTVDEEFEWATGQLASGCGSMKIGIFGPKLDTEKQKALNDGVGILLKTIGAAPKGKAPSDSKASGEPELSFKGSKFDCWVVHTYLKANGIDSYIRDSAVVPLVAAARWPAMHGKIKGADRLKKFVEQKLLRLGDKLSDAVALMTAQSGCFTPHEATAASSAISEAQLLAPLKKHFA